MRVAHVALGLLLVVGIVPSAGADDSTQDRYLNRVFDEVEVTRDIVYGEAVNDRGEPEILRLDLYEPAGDTLGRRPVVVFAHGGSGVSGDKSQMAGYSTAFAQRGFVTVSVNYRLMSRYWRDENVAGGDIVCTALLHFCGALNPEVHFRIKEAQHDVQAAVRWLRANAETYRIHPEQIVGAGFSFGTVLVLEANFEPEPAGNSNTSNSGFPSHLAGAMSDSGGMHEPSEIGPGEPPIIMWTKALDSFGALATTTMPCAVTIAAGNVCDLHVMPGSGHGVGSDTHAGTSEFFCRHVVESCAGGAIDIKPDDHDNEINTTSHGVVPVAILSGLTFDATTVDADTACFGDADAPDERDCTVEPGRSLEDVDGDGDTDLVLRFRTSETGIDSGDAEACLTAQTASGEDFSDCDAVSAR